MFNERTGTLFYFWRKVLYMGWTPTEGDESPMTFDGARTGAHPLSISLTELAARPKISILWGILCSCRYAFQCIGHRNCSAALSSDNFSRRSITCTRGGLVKDLSALVLLWEERPWS